MLISRQSYPRVDRVTIFLIALLVCFLPSLADIASSQEPSPLALPSEDFSDREERNSSLDGSDSFQNDALLPYLTSSLEPFVRGASMGEDSSAPWAIGITLYRPMPRPPPSLR